VLVTRRKVHKGRFKAVLMKAILTGWQLGTVKAHCTDPVFFFQSPSIKVVTELYSDHIPPGGVHDGTVLNFFWLLDRAVRDGWAKLKQVQ